MKNTEGVRELLMGGPECLTPEQLEMAASPELAPAERARLEGHLASCARCAAELSLLERFDSAAESMEERAPLAAMTARLDAWRAEEWPAAPARKRASWRSWFAIPQLNTWALVAATLLVVVGGSVYLRDLREPGVPPGIVTEVVRAAQVEAIGPAGELPRAPEYFEWKTMDGAGRYRVTVREVDGTALWSGETGESRLALPAEVRGRLLPAKTLTWEVEALAGGKVLASSGPVRFVVRP